MECSGYVLGSRTTLMDGFKLIPTTGHSAIGDFRRYPGCRLLMSCAACGWSKAYNPERVIARLQDLKAGGHATRLADVTRRVGWNCPRCSRMRWRMQFAWPAALSPAQARRLADRFRT